MSPVYFESPGDVGHSWTMGDVRAHGKTGLSLGFDRRNSLFAGGCDSGPLPTGVDSVTSGQRQTSTIARGMPA